MATAVTLPAAAHYSGFGGSKYQSRYTPADSTRCILDNGGIDCANHSYTFVSSKDVVTAKRVCAYLNYYWSAGHVVEGSCAPDFVRHCDPLYRHSNNDLDCHDQDHDTQIEALAGNPSNGGTTIQIHGGY
jgi:hypothetical protein